MNNVDKWIIDDDHNEAPIHVVAEDDGDYLVIYYYNEGGHMMSDWWDMNPFDYYKEIDINDIGKVDMLMHIKYVFEAEDYFAGGK